MPQKLPVTNFERIEDTFQFNQDFIKGIMKKAMMDIFWKLVYWTSTSRKYPSSINDLHSLPERMKIEKIKNLVANLHDKTEYVIHIRDLKQGLNQGSVLKKLHRINKFKQKAWLKSYTDMNKDLRKKAKYDFEKDFFRLMNM